jgi:molecular chaperone GrpE
MQKEQHAIMGHSEVNSNQVQEERDDAVDSTAGSSPVEASNTESAEPSADDLRAQIAGLEDKVIRARAEVQNVQKRAANERIDAVRYANAELMRALVPVLDDLDRSLEAAKGSAEPSALLDGTRMIRQNLLKALREHGLEEIEAVGLPFDPSLHEALLQQDGGGKPSGTVLEAPAKGYRLGDRVVRPAKVIVAK